MQFIVTVWLPESLTSGRGDADCWSASTTKEWWPACLFCAPYAQGHLGFCSGDRVRSRPHGAVEPLPLGVFLRVGRRRWCWWLSGIVGCGTTSVVLVASRGRRWCWWLAGSSVVVPGVGGVGGWPSSCGLSAAVWAVVTQPAVVSRRSAHPDRGGKL